MASPKSSAGSKDVTGYKGYLKGESSREALQSSWIRRLHLRPTSHSPPKAPPPTSPPPPPPVNNNSPSTTDSGVAMIGGHLTDTSSHESRTPTNPMLDASTSLFLHRLLKLRKEKPPLRADPESFSVFSGFGPFQVQTRRRVDVHNEVVKDDSVAGMNDGWNFNYSRNSSSDACFPTMTQLVVEEEEMEKNSSLQQQKWLPRNRTTLLTEKSFFSSENHNSTSSSSAKKPQEMLNNVENRRLSDEQHNNTHSPFFQYWSSLKKLVYTKVNPVTTTLPRNGCLFSSSGGEEADNNKFNNTNHPLPVAVGGENKCSSSSRNLVAGTQRLPIRRFPASPRSMTKASHETSYFSRNGGITYHESCYNGVAGSSYQGSHPTTQNAAPHQHERHTPACSNETDAPPSSFWNMNSFQRAEMVSSIFRANRTANKKRNANADAFHSMKSRKLDPEG